MIKVDKRRYKNDFNDKKLKAYKWKKRKLKGRY